MRINRRNTVNLFGLDFWQGGHKLVIWPQTWKTWNTQGFLWTWKTQRAASGKIITNEVFFSSSFKYLCKTAVDWVRHRQSAVVNCYIAGVDVEWPLMKVVITFPFCCNNLWKSKFLALEKPEKLMQFFFSYFVATLFDVCHSVCVTWLWTWKKQEESTISPARGWFLGCFQLTTWHSRWRLTEPDAVCPVLTV